MVRVGALAGWGAWRPRREGGGHPFIDPPYEHTEQDFGHVTAALAEGLRRFPTGVFAAWYPIKDGRRTAIWQAACARTLQAPALVCELWLYPRDSQVGLDRKSTRLNSSHLVISYAAFC